ncbi:MAG TPA: hypothetical protein VFA99_15135 [Acidobacteriaceae bacterium]|nr:hypothetical protein [Acidobacteriaceae bacterium]
MTKNPSTPQRAIERWSALRWSGLFAALTIATLLVHGYHPLAEDGGLYVAGVELTLNRSLFPHFTEFVSAHMHYSIFAPVVASITKLTHLPLLGVLLLIELLSIVLMLTGARAVLRRITHNECAQLAGIATVAALWTVPIAGTSLLLMDPYITARSLSTPLSLWAIAFAFDDWRINRRSLTGCVVTIALAAAFHPLMAGYALGLILVLRILRIRHKTLALVGLALLIIAATAILQAHAPAESAAVVLAAKSRYYWFLSQWHWYELFGLIAPLLVLVALRRSRFEVDANKARLCNAAILYGCFAAALALVFAHESYQAHIVARLQPLRAFLVIYLMMFLLLGAWLQQVFERLASRSSARQYTRYAMVPILLGAAVAMFIVQRDQFAASPHIELPWRLRQNPNPWVGAFLWCRDNTPPDALLALNAHYITTDGEDAQTFRAIALRSALPDFSKDGGEAAIRPRLADEWATGFTAQLDLDQQTTPELHAHLDPYGIGWVILRTNSPAVLSCPYRNDVLKVCQLGP